MKKIIWPKDKEKTNQLKAGECILFSGPVLAARDQAHKRLVETIDAGRKPPVDLKDVIIYYVGPTPALPGSVVGACGPTTSSRMDPFVLPLLKCGMKGMIGKGARSSQVRQALPDYKGIYFITIGGAGAYLSTKVLRCDPIAYKDLGPEAIFAMELVDFPLWVGIDSKGCCIKSS